MKRSAELGKCIGQINQWIEKIVPTKKKSVVKGYVWKLKAHDEEEQSEVEECNDIYYIKEHALAQAIKAGYKCGVSSELNIVEEWLPIPDELKILQKLYLYVIYKTCCFIAMQYCTGCDEQIISKEDAKHKVPNQGCQHITVVEDHFAVATHI